MTRATFRAAVALALLGWAAIAAAADIPRPEHPTPDAVRPHWANLNGPWEFRFDPKDEGLKAGWETPGAAGFDRQIVVPFPWESELSGIHQPEYRGVAWYRREFAVPGRLPQGRARLAPLRRGRLAGRRLGQRPARRRARGRIHPVRGRHHRRPEAGDGKPAVVVGPRLRPDRPEPADRQAGRLVHADVGDLADGLARVAAEGVHRAASRSRPSIEPAVGDVRGRAIESPARRVRYHADGPLRRPDGRGRESITFDVDAGARTVDASRRRVEGPRTPKLWTPEIAPPLRRDARARSPGRHGRRLGEDLLRPPHDRPRQVRRRPLSSGSCSTASRSTSARRSTSRSTRRGSTPRPTTSSSSAT